jgi:hypothetical protein
MAPVTRRLYNFRIDADLDEGLQAVKFRDGLVVSEQIRRAVRAWLIGRGVLKKARGSTSQRGSRRGR